MTLAILLGPQRFEQTVAAALESMEVSGPVATITAGWLEREPDDHELDAHLNGRSVNLRLYQRAEDVFHRDPEFAAAHLERVDRIDESEELYRLRLGHAMQAVYELQTRRGSPELIESEFDHAIDVVRALDERHLELVRDIHSEFYEKWPLHENELIKAHRDDIASGISNCDAVAIAGGHVGELLKVLHLFNIGSFLDDKPVVAWSAGAMAICQKVVLFHERAVHGPAHAEVYDDGLSLCRGMIPLPHARSRLYLEDRNRVGVFARRFAPDACVPFEDGTRLDYIDGGWSAPLGVRRLEPGGELESLGPS